MTFLNAEWRNLALANYRIDPKVLQPLLPSGTELDFFEDTCYVSLVGFLFQNTRVMGLPIPFHVNFEEVNLRFYVRRKVGDEWRRGVVFVKEIVPKPAITFVARTLYREPYVTMPMRHRIEGTGDQKKVAYEWKFQGAWQLFEVAAAAVAVPMPEGSDAEFITEHYYGYTRWNGDVTKTYQVKHPRWLVYPVRESRIEVDFAGLYGPDFAFLSEAEPVSVMLAEGSKIQVMGNEEA